MSIILSAEQEKFVQEKLKTGEYQSVNELITEAFELLKNKSQKAQGDDFSDKLSWQATYQEMAKEQEDWSDWEVTIADGLEEDETFEY